MKFDPDEMKREHAKYRQSMAVIFSALVLVTVGLIWEAGSVPTNSRNVVTPAAPLSQPRIGGSLQGFVGRYGPQLQLVENDPASPYAFNDGRVDLTVTLSGQTVREVSAYSSGWTPRDAQRYCLQFLPPGAERAMDNASTLYISSFGRSMLTVTSVECTLDSVA